MVKSFFTVAAGVLLISILLAGSAQAATITITGSNFANDAYKSVVSVDGVTYTPISITDNQIVVDIPALAAGTHTIQIVKGGDVSSQVSRHGTLTVTLTRKSVLTAIVSWSDTN